MVSLNGPLCHALARLLREDDDTALTIDAGELHRTIYVRRRKVIAAASNIPSERFGSFLTSRGRLTEEDLEQTVRDARQSGILLGDALVNLGVITGEELFEILVWQALIRFEQALTMPGRLVFGSIPATQPVLSRSPGLLIVDAFRERIPLSAIEAIALPALSRQPQRVPFDEAAANLGLVPSEVECWRELQLARTIGSVLPAPGHEPTLRLIGASIALELI